MSDPTALPNFPPPAEEHPLRGRVLDALIDLGLPRDIDGDGDVAFTVEEQQLFIRCAEGEVPMFRAFGQWQITPELNDPVRQLTACNEINLMMNCVKIGIGGGTLVVASDHVATEGSDVAPLVAIAIQAILTAVQQWHQSLMGENGDGTTPSEGAGQ